MNDHDDRFKIAWGEQNGDDPSWRKYASEKAEKAEKSEQPTKIQKKEGKCSTTKR